ncbi:hypothetical protein ABTN00_19970, partial [Acinetobacter baumannii]
HLGFDFTLHTEAAQAAIEDAFSFVREDCTLRITPPAPPAEVAAPAVVPEVAPAVPATSAATTAAPAEARKPKAREGAEDGRFIRVQADRLDA